MFTSLGSGVGPLALSCTPSHSKLVWGLLPIVVNSGLTYLCYMDEVGDMAVKREIDVKFCFFSCLLFLLIH